MDSAAGVIRNVNEMRINHKKQSVYILRIK